MTMGRPARMLNIFRRGIATLCAALVFTLGILAASPSLHERLHDNMAVGADHQCAIVAFANGISVPPGVVSIQPPAEHALEPHTPSAFEIILESPRFLLQPGRGPPLT